MPLVRGDRIDTAVAQHDSSTPAGHSYKRLRPGSEEIAVRTEGHVAGIASPLHALLRQAQQGLLGAISTAPSLFSDCLRFFVRTTTSTRLTHANSLPIASRTSQESGFACMKPKPARMDMACLNLRLRPCPALGRYYSAWSMNMDNSVAVGIFRE
jgi:hypothetical protein